MFGCEKATTEGSEWQGHYRSDSPYSAVEKDM